MNSLTLKWGTLKGWKLETPEAKSALKKYFDAGDNSMSAMMQHDTPEQKQALLEAIDLMDEIYLDWDDKYVSREEAKDYIRNYGKEQPVPEDHHDSTDSTKQKEMLGASDEHVKRMITFGEMWHRKKLTPKELADAITEAKRKHPESFPSHEQH